MVNDFVDLWISCQYIIKKKDTLWSVLFFIACYANISVVCLQTISYVGFAAMTNCLLGND